MEAPPGGGGTLISGTEVSGISGAYDLVIKFTPIQNYGPPIEVKVNGNTVETSSDPSNPNVRVLTIPASEITDNFSVTATATRTVNVTLSGTNCTIKSVNNTNLPANSTTATVQAGADATIVVEPNNDNYALYRECEVVIGGGTPTSMSYEKTGTLTIPGESITGNITITSTTKKLPDGVHLGTYTSGAFNGYKYLTFDNVSGNWIIIGTNGLCLGGAVENTSEITKTGQVLLLSAGCIGSQTFGNSNNWETSSVRATCGNIYNNSGLSNYNVIQQSLSTICYNDVTCYTNDHMFLLSGRGEKFDVQTYLGKPYDARLKGDTFWLRSGNNYNANGAYYVRYDGIIAAGDNLNYDCGVRPAFVLQI